MLFEASKRMVPVGKIGQVGVFVLKQFLFFSIGKVHALFDNIFEWRQPRVLLHDERLFHCLGLLIFL